MTSPFGHPTLSQFSERQLLPGSDASWRAILAGEAVVLRQLPASAEPAVRARLKRLGNVAHPAVVQRVQCFGQDDSLYLVRPWIEGSPAQLFGHALDERLPLARRLAEALVVMHGASLGHGRLHPANLIIEPRSGLRIVDPRLDGEVDPTSDLAALGHLLWRFEIDQPAAQFGDIDRADQLNRIARERVLPPRLARLILALLAGEVHAATEARDELEDIQLSLTRADSQVLAHWRQETIVPIRSRNPDQAAQEQEPPAVAGQSHPQPGVVSAGSRWPRLLTAAAAAVLLLALVFVVRFLPDTVAPESPSEVAAEPEPAVEPAAAAPPAVPSAVDLERLLRQREQAQAILDQLINLQLELEEQQVERWAKRAFSVAAARAAEGDTPFRRQQFDQAGQIYQEALDQLTEIAALRALVLAEALERGQYGLTSGDSQAASEAFELALAIDPEHPDALVGKARAETLDEVRALMAQVRAAQRDNRLDQARELLQRVLALDALTDGAADALAAVEQALSDGRFRAAMSEGLEALNRGRWNEARQALSRAARLNPGARAPADALLDLERRQRDARVAEVSGLAERAASEERWEAAVNHYTDLLAADPNLRAAQEGRDQAVERLDLDQRLRKLLDDPSRWWTRQGRTEAESLLYDARNIPAAGPRLRDQVNRLGAEIERARQPQVVTLESDNACQVVVYKVARLGQFQRRELSLLPGRYTAVGTRDGYRDVRVEFLVSTSGMRSPVNLKCEEQVLARG